MKSATINMLHICTLSHSLPPSLYRVTVTGIYRATPLRVMRRQRSVKAVYRTYVDAIHFRKTDARKLRVRDEEDEENEDG